MINKKQIISGIYDKHPVFFSCLLYWDYDGRFPVECSQVYKTNTHLDSNTHPDKHNHTVWSAETYLELHDEMCEMEFGLQVQSYTDLLLSCGGNVCHSVSYTNTSDVCFQKVCMTDLLKETFNPFWNILQQGRISCWSVLLLVATAGWSHTMKALVLFFLYLYILTAISSILRKTYLCFTCFEKFLSTKHWSAATLKPQTDLDDMIHRYRSMF